MGSLAGWPSHRLFLVPGTLGPVERRSVTGKGLFTLRLGGGVDPVTRGDVGREWGRLIRVAGTRELGFGLLCGIGGGRCGG